MMKFIAFMAQYGWAIWLLAALSALAIGCTAIRIREALLRQEMEQRLEAQRQKIAKEWGGQIVGADCTKVLPFPVKGGAHDTDA